MPVFDSTSFGGALTNAADSDDLLDILIDAITGVTTPTTGTLPAIEEWVVLKDDTTTVPGERFVYLEGPGLAGTDNIHVNIHRYDGSLNVRNWELKGATGFSDGLPFSEQPGGQPDGEGSIYTLRDLEMPFRLIVSGRRFILLTKVVASSMSMYCGLYLPFATPAEFPLPLFIGGNCAQFDGYASANDYRIGNFYDGPRAHSSNAAYSHSCFSIRARDGTWLSGGRYSTPTTTTTTRPSLNVTTLMFPWDYNSGEATVQGNNLFDHSLFTHPDGIATLMPAIPFHDTVDPMDYAFGELEGVFYTPTSVLTNEDTITVSGDTYFVIANTYRDNEVNVAFLLE